MRLISFFFFFCNNGVRCGRPFLFPPLPFLTRRHDYSPFVEAFQMWPPLGDIKRFFCCPFPPPPPPSPPFLFSHEGGKQDLSAPMSSDFSLWSCEGDAETFFFPPFSKDGDLSPPFLLWEALRPPQKADLPPLGRRVPLPPPGI